LLALKWVSQNIDRFGGDRNNVCLFGESAGAAAVHLHLLSDNSRPFFHKAICQSGTSTMEWVMQLDAADKARKLAKVCGFTGDAGDAQKAIGLIKHQILNVCILKLLLLYF
jgi:acetylcholinesterase